MPIDNIAESRHVSKTHNEQYKREVLGWDTALSAATGFSKGKRCSMGRGTGVEGSRVSESVRPGRVPLLPNTIKPLIVCPGPGPIVDNLYPIYADGDGVQSQTVYQLQWASVEPYYEIIIMVIRLWSI